MNAPETAYAQDPPAGPPDDARPPDGPPPDGQPEQEGGERRFSARRLVISVAVVLAVAGAIGLLSLWLHHRTLWGRLDAQKSHIRRAAREYGVAPDVIRAVIRVESSGHADAESGRGAKGLMQVTRRAERDVQRRFGIERPERTVRVIRHEDGRVERRTEEADLFDPEYNIRVGTAYLRMMLDRFDENLVLALAAYNMGPTALSELRRAHPAMEPWPLVRDHAPKETRNYVRKIHDILERELPG